MDVAISFWNKMKELTCEKNVYILDRVKGELTEWDNDLKRWIVDNVGSRHLLRFENDASVRKFREVNIWAMTNTHYIQPAKDKFMDVTRADIYLMSYAATAPDEWTVVSQERPAPLRSTEIILPDACAQFGVRCILFMDMFHEMHESF